MSRVCYEGARIRNGRGKEMERTLTRSGDGEALDAVVLNKDENAVLHLRGGELGGADQLLKR